MAFALAYLAAVKLYQAFKRYQIQNRLQQADISDESQIRLENELYEMA